MSTTSKRLFHWSRKEDTQLRKVAGKIGVGNWEEIAAQMPGRSAQQCSARWHRLLGSNESTTVKEQQWTEAEDWKVIDVLVSFGRTWSKMAARLPGRDAKEIQSRWEPALRYYARLLSQQYNVSQSEINLFGKDGCLSADVDETELIAAVRQGRKIPIRQNEDVPKDGTRRWWTEEEDRRIVDFLIEHGTDWLKMSEVFDNRSGDALCTRYYHAERRLKDYLAVMGVKNSRASLFEEGRKPRRIRQDVDPELLVKALRNKLNTSPHQSKLPARGTKVQTSNDAWSEEEDRRMIDFLVEHGTNWTKMAELFEGRTKEGLCTRFHHGETRYIKYMQKHGTKKGRIMPFVEGTASPRRLHQNVDRDILVKAIRGELNKNQKEAISENSTEGERKRKVSSTTFEPPELGTSTSQARSRVRTSSRKVVDNRWRHADWPPEDIAAAARQRNSATGKQWTEEEDWQILSFLVEHGTKWKELERRIVGRSYPDVRNRWHSTLQRRYIKFLMRKKGVSDSKINLFLNEDPPRRLRSDIDIDEVIYVTHNFDSIMMNNGASTSTGSASAKRKAQSSNSAVASQPTVKRSKRSPEALTTTE